MSSLIETYEVTVRLPNGTITKIPVPAMDHYTAQQLAEAMTGGKAMGAGKKN